MDEAAAPPPTGTPPAPPARTGRPDALLAALPEEERKLLAREFQPVELAFKQVLEEAGRPVGHVWFPRSSVASMLTETTEDGSSVEVAHRRGPGDGVLRRDVRGETQQPPCQLAEDGRPKGKPALIIGRLHWPASTWRCRTSGAACSSAPWPERPST